MSAREAITPVHHVTTREPELARELAKQPARRWKNAWRALEAHITVCMVCSAPRTVEKGDTYQSHCRTYPSRDLAETHAAALGGSDNRVYLGAQPVG